MNKLYISKTKTMFLNLIYIYTHTITNISNYIRMGNYYKNNGIEDET